MSSINPATLRLNNRTRDDAIGRWTEDVVGAEAGAEVNRHLAACLRSGAPYRYERVQDGGIVDRTRRIRASGSSWGSAETDLYFSKAEFGKLRQTGQMAPIDRQEVVRLNRDTLYSSGVFDLPAAPLTIALPDTGKRFISMQVINQDHDITTRSSGLCTG
jgi:hypothetical protein